MRAHKAKAALLVCAGVALAAAAVPAPASASSGQPSQTRVAAIDCTGQPQVRPGDFMLACGDGNNVLQSLRWSQWQPQSAAAEGNDLVNDCQPDCADGHFHSYRVHVRLDNPQLRPGHSGQWQYTRLTLTYAGDRPADTPRVVTSKLWS
ncbi:hypothetical protein ACTPOK_02350 [Streptomyces inhibens]|uniref:hypothetical protein n=1 Tax=Streptomyces inhibens TaxID=2293571 RepID=UPI00402A731F